MKHIDNVDVQKEACKILRRLSNNSVDNKVMISREGGIRHILCAMKKHAVHEDLQKEACRALCNLTHNSATNKIKFSGDEYIQVIINAMKKHIDIVAVQEKACRALSKFAANKESHFLASSKGLVPVIICVMVTHVTQAKLQNESYKVL